MTHQKAGAAVHPQLLVSEADLESRFFAAQRSIIGVADTLCILALAILVPVVLWDKVPWPPLILWSVVVVITTFGWARRTGPLGERSHIIGVWGSSLAWAVLPWLAFGALDSEVGAWQLAAICGYGLATDAILLPQTYRIPTAWVMATYLISYLVALAVTGHPGQLAGLALLALPLFAGVVALDRLKVDVLRSQVRLSREAHIDSLTGLAARGAVIAEVDHRMSLGEPVHCLVLDVDDFKAINTHLGHHGGDAALSELAGQLKARLGGWYLGRLGGDEFVAINDREATEAERASLRSVDVGNVGGAGGRSILNLSVGATSGAWATSADEVLVYANAALRRAKQLGKRRFVQFDHDLLEEESEKQALAGRLHDAIASGEIAPFAQPIVDLNSGEVAGVELLARWTQPNGETYPPAKFLPVIEAQGLGSLLGTSMIAHAIDALVSLADRGNTETFVSVNLSALDLVDTELPDRLRRRLSEAGVAPDRLVLEMTESHRLPDSDTAREVFDNIRAIGIGIASDDVGSGWSSINQLIQRDFSHLKIDRLLIHSARAHDFGELLASLEALAARANQLAIVEGIETEADLRLARDAGFRLGQGFLLAKPAHLQSVLEALHLSAAS